MTFWPAEPSTHQLSSSPSLRTNTIVVGPSSLGLTSTSPDRESATRNSPSTGLVKPTKSTANPRAASTGSVYRVVESGDGHTAPSSGSSASGAGGDGVIFGSGTTTCACVVGIVT